MTTKKTAAHADAETPPADHCVDKAGHNYNAATTKTLSENPTNTSGQMATFTQHEIKIFCTRCGKSALLSGLPEPVTPPVVEEYRNV